MTRQDKSSTNYNLSLAKFFSLGPLAVALMFLISSCGIGWELPEEGLSADGRGKGGVKITKKDRGGMPLLTDLRFTSPQRPLDFRKRGIFRVENADSGSGLSGISLRVSHVETNEVLFGIKAAAAIESGGISFSLPSGLNSRMYRVVQLGGKEEISSEVLMDNDDRINYKIK